MSCVPPPVATAAMLMERLSARLPHPHSNRGPGGSRCSSSRTSCHEALWPIILRGRPLPCLVPVSPQCMTTCNSHLDSKFYRIRRAAQACGWRAHVCPALATGIGTLISSTFTSGAQDSKRSRFCRGENVDGAAPAAHLHRITYRKFRKPRPHWASQQQVSTPFKP